MSRFQLLAMEVGLVPSIGHLVLVDIPGIRDILALRQLPEGAWQLVVLQAGHRYGPSHHPGVYSCHRKRPALAYGAIELLGELQARAVASRIRENHGVLHVQCAK